MVNNSNIIDYRALSRKIRRTVLRLIHETKSPHIGSSLSVVEILVALYFNHLNVSSDNLLNPERDRFILSKGHACVTLYAVLAERGFIDSTILDGFAVNGGTLEHHPNIDLNYGIELSTGSLGHGISVGCGMALAGKIDKKKYRVCVLASDGEMNEGSVWEGIMFAGHHKLNNLTVFVDLNRMQALGFTKDIINLDKLYKKWAEFNWHAQEINGHNFEEIFNSLNNLSNKKPNVIVLKTVKGKGISFMENELLWHYRAPNDNEYKNALMELEL